jgi:hypothetical protein
LDAGPAFSWCAGAALSGKDGARAGRFRLPPNDDDVLDGGGRDDGGGGGGHALLPWSKKPLEGKW